MAKHHHIPLLRRVSLRWDVFWHNYRWSDWIVLFDGWVAKVAFTVPIVGYLILFNDSVSLHLTFAKLTGESVQGLGVSASARLKFVYYGLIFLGLANIIYRIRRPFVIRIATNEFDYVERGLKHFTPSAYIRINDIVRSEGHFSVHGKYYDAEYDAFMDLALGSRVVGKRRVAGTGDWNAAKLKFEGLMRSMLIENFLRHVVQRRIALTFCILFALLGYALLLVPSTDIFVKVLQVTFLR